MKKHAQRDILQKVIRAVAIVKPPFCLLQDYMCLFAGSGTTDGGSLAVLQCVHMCAFSFFGGGAWGVGDS